MKPLYKKPTILTLVEQSDDNSLRPQIHEIKPNYHQSSETEQEFIKSFTSNLSLTLILTTAESQKNFVRKFAMNLDFAAECFGAKIKY